MRITPLMIVEAVLTLLLAICCLYTWSSGSYQRSTAGAWRDARAAMRAGEGSKAADALERLLELKPAYPGVRLQLAGLYLADDKTTLATPHLEKVAKDVSSDVPGGIKGRKRLQALAEVMLGMIKAKAAAGAFGAGGAEAKARFDAAKGHFEAAIKLENPDGLEIKTAEKGDPEKSTDGSKAAKGGAKSTPKPAGRPGRVKFVAFGDACAGLGLIALWVGEFEVAEVRLRQAIAGDSLLGKGVHAEAYNGLGVALAANGKFSESSAMFRRALNYRPGWKLAKKNHDLIRRAMAGSDRMTKNERGAFLKELIKRNPNPDYTMCNLLGCGWYRQGDLKRAVINFQKAIKKDPEKRLAQFNLLALRWNRLKETRAAYLKVYAKLFPVEKVDSRERFWRTPALGHKKAGLTKAQKDRYSDVSGPYFAAANAFDDQAAAVLKHIRELPPERTRALLEIRLRHLLTTSQRLERSSKAKTRASGRRMRSEFDRLWADAVKRFPKQAGLWRLGGVAGLGKEEYGAALDAFRKSLAENPDQADVKAVLALFAGEPRVSGFRPQSLPLSTRDSVLAGSARPLLGVMFRAETGPVQLSGEKASLKLDGKPVAASFWGSELIYRPAANLSDGHHELTAEVEDLLGRKAKGTRKVLVDNSPPEISKMEPSAGASISDRLPKLTVYYNDKYSGIDPTSITVELRSDRGASVYFSKFAVMGGRYTYGHENAAKGVSFKAGDSVGKDKVVLVPHRKLGTGRYKVSVTVGDVRGLKTTKDFYFTVIR